MLRDVLLDIIIYVGLGLSAIGYIFGGNQNWGE